MLSLQKPVRHRSRKHLGFVAGQKCCADRYCTEGVQVHHLTIAPDNPKARGLKAGDQWCVPVCSQAHNALHARGDERAWWLARGIDPIALARRLWALSLAAGRA